MFHRLTSLAAVSSLSTVFSRNFGAKGPAITNTLKFERYDDRPGIPTYQMMDKRGDIVDVSRAPQLSQDEIVNIYQKMVTINILDNILYEIQRQGRISFYMTAFGEEATHIGSASALQPADVIFGQYREMGVLLYRGFSIPQIIDQCFGNSGDGGKGRQMPVHYGSRKLNFHTISSPLGTQIPQASGAAYAQKLLRRQNVTVCFFGEGAASEGDFHPALNFAQTLRCPVVFFCRNNGYAISTPAEEQYAGDGIASRGIGYGIDTVRVDGNDVFAVREVMLEARKVAITETRPVLVEAMTYRVGHHSTSDDSSRYRTVEEVEYWKKFDNPISRLRQYMEKNGMWDKHKEQQFQTDTRQMVLATLKESESKKKPPIDELFNDVFDVLPPHLVNQKADLMEHCALHPDYYELDTYTPSNK